jgi:hypothetical protein
MFAYEGRSVAPDSYKKDQWSGKEKGGYRVESETESCVK